MIHALTLTIEALTVQGLCLLIGFLVRKWLRLEVKSEVDHRLASEVKRLRATRDIRETLRETSRAMLDAALSVTVEEKHEKD